MPLNDTQITNIVFNETRSLSGTQIQEARKNIAHAIINGDNTLGARRPRTAPTTVEVPAAEQTIHQQCQNAVSDARNERSAGNDPTQGAIYFNFRRNNSTSDFFSATHRTQVGPLNNSYPTDALPATGIYANTYGN